MLAIERYDGQANSNLSMKGPLVADGLPWVRLVDTSGVAVS